MQWPFPGPVSGARKKNFIFPINAYIYYEERAQSGIRIRELIVLLSGNPLQISMFL
jgi:hypothetical protein